MIGLCRRHRHIDAPVGNMKTALKISNQQSVFSNQLRGVFDRMFPVV